MIHKKDFRQTLTNHTKVAIERFQKAKKNIQVHRRRAKQAFYELRLRAFLNRRRTWVGVTSHFIKRKLVYLTIVYVAVALFTTWLSGIFVMPKEDATTFFTAGGGMVGAALAIILTFNTLIINFASTEFPPEFYKATGYDWRQHVIYFLLAANATALFVFSLVFKTSETDLNLWLFPLATLIICVSFYLLFVSYLVTRKRLDPAAGLAIIRNIAIKHLVKGVKSGDKLAKVFATNPNLKPEDKALARKEAHRMTAPLLEQVSIINGYLHDYHDKLLAKQNFATAAKVLDTIYAILVKYIEARRDNMQARVSSQYFLAFTTDTQGFFEKNLQQLVDKAKRYMDAKNDTGAIHITDLMCNLAQHASMVKFEVRENPLLDQVQGYINSITEEAVTKKDAEVMFHLADVYSVLGRQATSKKLPLSQSSVYDQLVKIGQMGAASKQSSITGRVADAFNAILVEIHNQNAVQPGREPRQLIDKYQNVVMIYCLGVGSERSAMLSNPQMLAPYNTILNWMSELARLPADQIDHQTRSTFMELSETIRRSMRSMSDTISLGDHSISVELGVTIRSAVRLILELRSKEGWQSVDAGLINQANWFTHQLTWLKEKTVTASEYITRELVEDAGDIGLRALEADTPDVAKASVEVVANLSSFFLEKAKKDSGYEPARFMQTACLIGVYAKKLGMNEIYELAKAKASGFNVAFNRKHFPDGPPNIPDGVGYIGIYPDHLLRELEQLYEEPNYEFGVMASGVDTLEDRFGQYIDREDVQSFIVDLLPAAPSDPVVAQGAVPTKEVDKSSRKSKSRRRRHKRSG